MTMAFCGNCGTQLNEGTKFCPKCGKAIDIAPQQQVYRQMANAYQAPQQPPVRPSSYMVLSILTTLFCCLPTGIYAIIQSAKVDKLYMSGEYDEAVRVAGEAKKWSIIGIVLAAIVWIIYIIAIVTGTVVLSNY